MAKPKPKPDEQMDGHFIFNGIPVRIDSVSGRWKVRLGNPRYPTTRVVDSQPTRRVISDLVQRHETFYAQAT
jgi:hypothetical protein